MQFYLAMTQRESVMVDLRKVVRASDLGRTGHGCNSFALSKDPVRAVAEALYCNRTDLAVAPCEGEAWSLLELTLTADHLIALVDAGH